LLNIAHRGASARFPENTLRAFSAAFEFGADMCELDVRLTRDGVPIVLHDATVDRTTDGRGAVATMSLQKLRSLDAGVKFGAGFIGELVPTLAEVFHLTLPTTCRGQTNLPNQPPGKPRPRALNLELKGADTEGPVCDLIRANDAVDSTLVSSFDWAALSRVRDSAPEIRIGLLSSKRPAELLAAALDLRANAINPRFDIAGRDLCAKAHSHGIQVYVWTVDDVDLMRVLIAIGVDGIMTNYPERLASLREVKVET